MAIVRRSLPDVERLGSLAHNQPECKKRGALDVLELALGWDAGLRHLVLKGYPIWTAFKRACSLRDSASIPILVETPTSIFVTEKIFSLACMYCMSGSVLKTVVRLVSRQLSRRRSTLRQLAMRHLTPQDQEKLGLHEDNLRETSVKLTFERLQCIIKVPESLMCWISPYIAQTFSFPFRFLAPVIPDILNILYEAGFHAVDVCDEKGQTPLFTYLKWFMYDRWLEQTDFLHMLVIAQWFLSKGARCVLGKRLIPRSGWPTVPFYVAERLAHTVLWRSAYWEEVTLRDELESIRDMSEMIPEGVHTISDACICFCSTGGCLSCHRLCLRCRLCSFTQYLHDGREEDAQSMDRSCLLTPFILAWNMDYEEEELTYSESARLDVFERLGMAHTCCEVKETLTAEERERLREEDAELAKQLDSLIAEYHRGRQAHTGSAESFWRVWRQALDQILPPVLIKEDCKVWGKDEAVQARRAAREREALEAAGYVGPQYDNDFPEVIRAHFRDRDWNPVLPAEEDDGLFDKDLIDSLRQPSSRRRVSDDEESSEEGCDEEGSDEEGSDEEGVGER